MSVPIFSSFCFELNNIKLVEATVTDNWGQVINIQTYVTSCDIIMTFPLEQYTILELRTFEKHPINKCLRTAGKNWRDPDLKAWSSCVRF